MLIAQKQYRAQYKQSKDNILECGVYDRSNFGLPKLLNHIRRFKRSTHPSAFFAKPWLFAIEPLSTGILIIQSQTLVALNRVDETQLLVMTLSGTK
jgi:hypothetical protein